MEVIVVDLEESLSPASDEGTSCYINEEVLSLTVPHTEPAGITTGQISTEIIETKLNSRTGNLRKIIIAIIIQ